nr:hypothetical protein [Tanacetum cinerariifolium]
MSIYDFICMLSLDGAKVREEPHNLGIPLMVRTITRTLSETVIPMATLKEIVVTQPDHAVVTKAKNAAKRKASTQPEVSTNVTKKTKVGKKKSRAGFGNRVEQADDGTLDDDAQGDDIGSVADDFEHLDDISQNKEVSAATNIKSSGGLRRETRTGSQVSHEADAQVFDTGGDTLVSHVTEPKDTDFCVDEPRDTEHKEDGYIGSDRGNGNLVNSYDYDAQVGAEVRRIETLSLEELIGRDKKHRKFKAERAAKEVIAAEKAKVNEELVKGKSQLELQETELKELKYQLSRIESDTHLHNDIITSHEKQAKEVRSDVTSFF